MTFARKRGRLAHSIADPSGNEGTRCPPKERQERTSEVECIAPNRWRAKRDEEGGAPMAETETEDQMRDTEPWDKRSQLLRQ